MSDDRPVLSKVLEEEPPAREAEVRLEAWFIRLEGEALFTRLRLTWSDLGQGLGESVQLGLIRGLAELGRKAEAAIEEYQRRAGEPSDEEKRRGA